MSAYRDDAEYNDDVANSMATMGHIATTLCTATSCIAMMWLIASSDDKIETT